MYNFKVVGFKSLRRNWSSDIVDNDVVLVSTVVENSGLPLNYIENRAKHWTLCDATKNIMWHKWVGFNY